ncbi:MAG: NfeD family protein [Candidatus Binatia bacterium]
MTTIPLLAVSKEILTIGILLGSIFLILLLMEIQICQVRLRALASEKGCSSASDTLDGLLSAEGVAITTLSPSGIANIKGDEVVVISEGEMILKNTGIKVTDVKGNRIVVKPVKT